MAESGGAAFELQPSLPSCLALLPPLAGDSGAREQSAFLSFRPARTRADAKPAREGMAPVDKRAGPNASIDSASGSRYATRVEEHGKPIEVHVYVRRIHAALDQRLSSGSAHPGCRASRDGGRSPEYGAGRLCLESEGDAVCAANFSARLRCDHGQDVEFRAGAIPESAVSTFTVRDTPI